MHRVRGVVASVVVALLLGSPTLAQPTPPSTSGQVEALAEQANAAYDAQQYDQAVALYLEAYRRQPAAAVLYNVAIIYDKKLGEPELATTFYRRYIGAPDAEPAVVKRATVRLAELRAQATRAEAPRFDAPAPPVAAKAEPKLHPQAMLGWSLAGLGAMALIGGGAMGLVAHGSHDDYIAARTVDAKLAAREDGEAQALAADVLITAGAVVSITGVVLALTAPSAAKAAVQIGPTPDGAGAALWLGGTL